MKIQNDQDFFYDDSDDKDTFTYNFNIKTSEIKSKSFTKDTVLALDDQRILVVAENPSDFEDLSNRENPEKSENKNISVVKSVLKFYRMSFDVEEKEMIFICFRTKNLHGSVVKLAHNASQNLIFVGYSDGRIVTYFFDQTRSVNSNGSHTLGCVLEEMKTIIGSSYSASSMLVTRLQVNKINKQMIKKNNKLQFVTSKIKIIDIIKHDIECLVVFDEKESSIQYFSLDDCDDIYLALSYKIKHLCHVKKILELENNVLVFGGYLNQISEHSRNLFTLNMSNLSYNICGWNQLKNVADMVYFEERKLLFVASECQYFSVLRFNPESLSLSPVSYFSPDLNKPGILSLKLVFDLKRPILLVTNDSNKIFSYIIDNQGTVSPFKIQFLKDPVIGIVDLKMRNQMMLVDGDQKKGVVFCFDFRSGEIGN